MAAASAEHRLRTEDGRASRGTASRICASSDDDDESDEFARSVERDLANLPTIDERDRR